MLSFDEKRTRAFVSPNCGTDEDLEHAQRSSVGLEMMEARKADADEFLSPDTVGALGLQ